MALIDNAAVCTWIEELSVRITICQIHIHQRVQLQHIANNAYHPSTIEMAFCGGGKISIFDLPSRSFSPMTD